MLKVELGFISSRSFEALFLTETIICRNAVRFKAVIREVINRETLYSTGHDIATIDEGHFRSTYTWNILKIFFLVVITPPATIQIKLKVTFNVPTHLNTVNNIFHPGNRGNAMVHSKPA